MQVNPNIFKAYDVRGLYPQEINEEVARAIGRGFVSYLKAARIAVGRSDVEPAKGDRRFKDPAWSGNPVFQRIERGYLATAEAVTNVVEEYSEKNAGRRAEQARFGSGRRIAPSVHKMTAAAKETPKAPMTARSDGATASGSATTKLVAKTIKADTAAAQTTGVSRKARIITR